MGATLPQDALALDTSSSFEASAVSLHAKILS